MSPHEDLANAGGFNRWLAFRRMTGPSYDEFEAALGSGELVRARVTIDSFHASKHNLYPSSPEIVIANTRFILFSWRGVLRNDTTSMPADYSGISPSVSTQTKGWRLGH